METGGEIERFDQYFPKNYCGAVDDVRNMVKEFVFHDEIRLTQLVSTTKQAVGALYCPPTKNGLHVPEMAFMEIWPYVYRTFGLSFKHYRSNYAELHKYWDDETLPIRNLLQGISDPSLTYDPPVGQIFQLFEKPFWELLEKWGREEGYLGPEMPVWLYVVNMFLKKRDDVAKKYENKFPDIEIIDPYKFSKLRSVVECAEEGSRSSR